MGYWNTPWYFTGRTVGRARDGSRRGEWNTFLVMGCNSAASGPCPAQLLVSVDSILDLAPTHIEGEG